MKPRRLAVVAVVAICLLALTACAPLGPLGASAWPVPTPTATSAPTAPPTPTATPTATPSPTPQPAPTATATPNPSQPGVPPAPIASGKVILVSLDRQWLYAYENGQLVFDHAVETGRPELPTPTGTFSILSKTTDTWFHSPWPKGSPYYYEPSHVNYALLFKSGGFYLHDAPWHVRFGPGSNVPHQLDDGTWETGSHGCVGMTTADGERLYEWSRIGTAVVIR